MSPYIYIFGFMVLVMLRTAKKSSISLFLILLQVASLIAAFLIGVIPEIQTGKDYLIVLYTFSLLYMFIAPWRKHHSIKSISSININKADKLFKILVGINIFSVLVLSFVAINVLLSVPFIAILAFKADGLKSLPVITDSVLRMYTIAQFIVPLGLLMLPFHFYYLSKDMARKAQLSFFLSLTPILYGLTYFSRSSIVHYSLIYLILFILVRKSLPEKHVKRIKRIGFIIGAFLLSIFTIVTIIRFEYSTNYSDMIDHSSIIQNSSLYSAFDYFCQWHYFNYDTLSSFKGNTMKGQLIFHEAGNFFALVGIVPSNESAYLSQRMHLLGSSYDNFIGLVSYLVYDFGFIIAFLISFLYKYFVNKVKPQNNSITLENLYFILFLIQIPLFSIFYSMGGYLMQALLYFLPIYFFVYRTKIGSHDILVGTD